ncbi:hypothetical protein HMPREF1448_00434 [Helicobacter pylori HP260AFi]|uniref:Uncharacterized protein n=1 Tax=Helicobacter pylori HP260AFii TaxID=1159077 RepID=A0ABC9S9R5_HELPX|nr:hypothetical protein HMPREF1416_00508 [Helicobacter pylori GAM260ASi]EMH32110.1 hypothetical protein HMPREF1422_00135 [Helicobacter pylori GAM268Bii]EMH64393.1 hypothetical protein HMPREF1448_00434 [Helicobacter pylori HP260AFi]EMH66971.1 hypothetical protein HMPREF1449_00807 [Helicobacter pylori HP260AFii]EMH70026.1 hypothetical protein HMPREF1450_00008 [Helicobacter pylori HP260ASii]
MMRLILKLYFLAPHSISSPIISNNFYPFLSNSKFSFKLSKL